MTILARVVLPPPDAPTNATVCPGLIDKDEIIHALKAAQCLDIIEKLPNGIDTYVGTKGVYLSGGEQQRIAIARAILKNAAPV